jgi:hypothetical protein
MARPLGHAAATLANSEDRTRGVSAEHRHRFGNPAATKAIAYQPWWCENCALEVKIMRITEDGKAVPWEGPVRGSLS